MWSLFSYHWNERMIISCESQWKVNRHAAQTEARSAGRPQWVLFRSELWSFSVTLVPEGFEPDESHKCWLSFCPLQRHYVISRTTLICSSTVTTSGHMRQVLFLEDTPLEYFSISCEQSRWSKTVSCCPRCNVCNLSDTICAGFTATGGNTRE